MSRVSEWKPIDLQHTSGNKDGTPIFGLNQIMEVDKRNKNHDDYHLMTILLNYVSYSLYMYIC